MGSVGFVPFGATFALVLLAALPVLAAWNESPAIHEEGAEAAGFLSYIWLVPTATAAVLVFGAVETGGFALFPVYGNRIGYGEADAALLLTMIGLGNVILQIPLGIFSDRIHDRRVLLAACSAIGLLGMVALPFLAHNWYLTAAMLFVWGGVVAGLYTVGPRPSRVQTDRGNSRRPTPPSCSATASACCLGPRRSASAWTCSVRPAFGYALALFFVAYSCW
jgi:predicted MFS family arabinose efflux permease